MISERMPSRLKDDLLRDTMEIMRYVIGERNHQTNDVLRLRLRGKELSSE